MQKIRKIQRTDFEKSLKNPIFGQIWAKICRMRFFFENRAPLFFRVYGYLPSCKKSEKTNDPILRKAVDRRTDRGQFIGPYLW